MQIRKNMVVLMIGALFGTYVQPFTVTGSVEDGSRYVMRVVEGVGRDNESIERLLHMLEPVKGYLVALSSGEGRFRPVGFDVECQDLTIDLSGLNRRSEVFNYFCVSGSREMGLHGWAQGPDVRYVKGRGVFPEAVQSAANQQRAASMMRESLTWMVRIFIHTFFYAADCIRRVRPDARVEILVPLGVAGADECGYLVVQSSDEDPLNGLVTCEASFADWGKPESLSWAGWFEALIGQTWAGTIREKSQGFLAAALEQ